MSNWVHTSTCTTTCVHKPTCTSPISFTYTMYTRLHWHLPSKHAHVVTTTHTVAMRPDMYILHVHVHTHLHTHPHVQFYTMTQHNCHFYTYTPLWYSTRTTISVKCNITRLYTSSLCICINTYMTRYNWVHILFYIYIFNHLCIHVCMYDYMYVCIHIHTMASTCASTRVSWMPLVRPWFLVCTRMHFFAKT